VRLAVEWHTAETLTRAPWGRQLGGDGWEGPDRVRRIWTPCHFGGMRPWLLCPECGRRCAKLYRPWGRSGLGCRRCLGLTYQTQQVHRFDRLRIAQERLRRRLGGTGEPREHFPDKPPRMHWRTYLRAQERYAELEAGIWAEYRRMVSGLVAYVDRLDATRRR
jgi:hypothetical protein